MEPEIKAKLKSEYPAVEELLFALWHLLPGDLTIQEDQREKLLPEMEALVTSHYDPVPDTDDKEGSPRPRLADQLPDGLRCG